LIYIIAIGMERKICIFCSLTSRTKNNTEKNKMIDFIFHGLSTICWNHFNGLKWKKNISNGVKLLKQMRRPHLVIHVSSLVCNSYRIFTIYMSISSVIYSLLFHSLETYLQSNWHINYPSICVRYTTPNIIEWLQFSLSSPV
jgi:hypothetical protein